MWIGRGESRPETASGLRSDAVGDAHRSVGPVVVARPHQTGTEREVGVDGKRVGDPELRDVQHGLFFGGADDSDQVVDDLGKAQRGQHGIAAFEELAHVRGRRFTP